MSGGAKSLWPVHSGCSTVSARIGTGLAGGRGANRPNSPTSRRGHARHHRCAVAALAAAHADAAGTLQRGGRIVTGRDQAAQLARRHLLAATDDGVVVHGSGIDAPAPRTAAKAPPGSARRGAACAGRRAARPSSGRDRPRWRPPPARPQPSRRARRRSARRRRWRRPRRGWCGRRRRSASPSSRCRAARSDGRSPARAPAPTTRRSRSSAPRCRRRSAGRLPRCRARDRRPRAASPGAPSAACCPAAPRARSHRPSGRDRQRRRLPALAICAQPGPRSRLEHGHDVGAAVQKLGGGLQAERPLPAITMRSPGATR